MVEWQFKERMAEVSRQHENFKNDSDYELMQLLIDVRNDSNAIAYNRVNDFLLETTARAYGKNHTIDAINNDTPLRDGLILHSKEITVSGDAGKRAIELAIAIRKKIDN